MRNASRVKRNPTNFLFSRININRGIFLVNQTTDCLDSLNEKISKKEIQLRRLKSVVSIISGFDLSRYRNEEKLIKELLTLYESKRKITQLLDEANLNLPSHPTIIIILIKTCELRWMQINRYLGNDFFPDINQYRQDKLKTELLALRQQK
jgi:hypothetical protein